MKQNLRVSLGAVVLALATLAAMIFAWLNFIQRTEFETPDDGVVWLDTTQGIQAQQVAPGSTRVGAYRPKRATERRSRLASMRTHIQLPEQHKSTFNHINYRFTER